MSDLAPEHSTYLYTTSFDSVHVTRSYTNPINGIQSIAFCDVVNLTAGDGKIKKALLMRVVPLENVTGKWSFPTDRYEDAQISMIDSDGNYIIKGKSFKNSTSPTMSRILMMWKYSGKPSMPGEVSQ